MARILFTIAAAVSVEGLLGAQPVAYSSIILIMRFVELSHANFLISASLIFLPLLIFWLRQQPKLGQRR